MGREKLGVDIARVSGYKRSTSTKTICCLEPNLAELRQEKVFEGKWGQTGFPRTMVCRKKR
jgi:hypothetical protein